VISGKWWNFQQSWTTDHRSGPSIGSKEELEKVKATLPVGKWNAQWMQSPTSEEGAIIKREWWREWIAFMDPGPGQHVIQSYDTAFLKKETADFSAITTWGVFYENEDSPASLILLDMPSKVDMNFLI
jgi:hypothetical protein